MAAKLYFIRERINPQTGTYFVPQGQLSLTEAKRYESTLYGTNIMHRFKTKEDYESRLAQLKESGRRIR